MKAFCIVLFAGLLAGCVNGRDCTLVGCEQGVEIDFRTPYSEPGTYTITVDVDGARTTCTVLLPMSPAPGKPCDQDSVGVRYALSDAGSEKVIASLGLTATNAKSITVRVVKDGTELANATFAPAYVSSPGPNGASCDAHETDTCTFAQKDLP